MTEIVALGVGGLLVLAWVAFVRYEIALTILLGIIPAYLLRFSLGPVPTNVFEIAVVLVGLCGVVQSVPRRQYVQAWQKIPRAFLGWTALFVFACVLSVAVSGWQGHSLGILKSWVLAPIVLGYLVLASSSKQRIQAPLISSGVAVALIGLLQMGSQARITSIYDVPNSLALWLTPLVIMSAWHGVITAKKIYMAAAVVMLLAVIMTRSGAAILTLCLVAIGVMMLQISRPYRRNIILGFVLMAAVASAYFSASGRLNYYLSPWQNGTPNSLSVREQLWSVSLDLISDHALLGVGLGQFEPVYQQYVHARFKVFEQCQARLEVENCQAPLPEFVFRDPHNWILSFWLNVGLLGLISFSGIHVYLAWYGRKTLVKNQQAVGLMLAILSLFIFGLVDTIYWKNDLAALHWVLLATLLIDLRSDKLLANFRSSYLDN